MDFIKPITLFICVFAYQPLGLCEQWQEQMYEDLNKDIQSQKKHFGPFITENYKKIIDTYNLHRLEDFKVAQDFLIYRTKQQVLTTNQIATEASNETNIDDITTIREQAEAATKLNLVEASIEAEIQKLKVLDNQTTILLESWDQRNSQQVIEHYQELFKVKQIFPAPTINPGEKYESLDININFEYIPGVGSYRSQNSTSINMSKNYTAFVELGSLAYQSSTGDSEQPNNIITATIKLAAQLGLGYYQIKKHEDNVNEKIQLHDKAIETAHIALEKSAKDIIKSSIDSLLRDDFKNVNSYKQNLVSNKTLLSLKLHQLGELKTKASEAHKLVSQRFESRLNQTINSSTEEYLKSIQASREKHKQKLKSLNLESAKIISDLEKEPTNSAQISEYQSKLNKLIYVIQADTYLKFKYLNTKRTAELKNPFYNHSTNQITEIMPLSNWSIFLKNYLERNRQ